MRTLPARYESGTAPDERVEVGGGRAILFGMVLIALAFGGFGLWAATAPLDSAAVAQGAVHVESYRKTVQHREGGIVRVIEVADGSRVQAGDVLIRLDDTVPKARLNQLLGQYYDGLANRARLVAERDGLPAVDWARHLPAGSDPRIAEVRRAQQALFETRRQFLDGRIAVMRQRLGQLREESLALAAERRSKARQLALIEQEVAVVEKLHRQGLALRPRLLALQRDQAKLEGERDDFGARIARVGQQAATVELEMASLRNERLDAVAADLRETETQLRDAEQEMTAARDALERTTIRAPQAGAVVNLKVHTRGGVAAAGEPLLEIVPHDDVLVIEARVQPDDIDVVHEGLPATLRFTAFKQAVTPSGKGRVTRISADRMTDERTGDAYFLARIEVDQDSLSALPTPLYPGMPVDVLIATGQRTALDYFLSPLTQAMALAFREQ